MCIEKIIRAPEPGFETDEFNTFCRLLDKLGWDNYRTHYTGEELDSGEYGDDVYDYSIMVPKDEMDIFDLLDVAGVFEDFD